MIYFIIVLRAIAAVLITNSHYTGIYPNDIIANGGLLGDVIFFGVSGFCLVSISISFKEWYIKRIMRVYPSVWIVTAIYMILGFYDNSEFGYYGYFIYPTIYHFVASIIILYIPFYIVMTVKLLCNNLKKVMGVIFIVQMVIYILLYDKSIYHIDTVKEPMIRFLFFQSMLLGAYFRININNYLNLSSVKNWLYMFLIGIIYFISKVLFIKIDAISSYQIINQIILFVLLYQIFICFLGIEDILLKLPKKIKKVIEFISTITLEIYLVQ